MATGDIPGQNGNSDDFPGMEIFEENKDDQKAPEGSPQKPTEGGEAPVVFQIDPKFAHLPKEEALKRSAQSVIDKLKDSNTNLLSQIDKGSKYAQFFDVLSSDANIAKAFLRKLHPTMFVDEDVDTAIKQQLSKMPKFQGDFQFKPTEANTPGTLSWSYSREYAKLEDKYKTSDNKDFDQLIADRKAAHETDIEKLKSEIAKIKTDMNYTDDDIKTIDKWFNGMTMYQKAQIYRFAMSRKTPKVPKPGELRTGGNLPRSTEAQAMADKFFGPDKSGVNANRLS